MSNDILVDDEASYTETTKINDNASNDIAPNDTYTVIIQLKTSDTKPNGRILKLLAFMTKHPVALIPSCLKEG